MKNLQENSFLKKLSKETPSILFIFFMILFVTKSVIWVDATVITNPGNMITGGNNNYVNLSNSGSYSVNFNLSGTLDAADIFQVVATDGSGNTATGSFLSMAGGQSSGSVLLNLSNNFVQGLVSYSGMVYSGGLMNQVTASGITLTGTIDTIPPVVSLVGSGTMSIPQGGIYSESGATWTDGMSGSGTLAVANSGSVNTALTGSYILQYWKIDTANNTSSVVSRTVSVIASIIDTTAPNISITSHANNATVTGVPTLSGLVSDTGGIANVKVNGATATLGSGSWSYVLSSLSGGSNMITVIATDLAGNTGSTSITLNRVSLPSMVNATLSGNTSAIITFSTDLSATGVVLYGTGQSSLNMTATGSSAGMSHSFTLTGLLMNTTYYFLAQGQGGMQSTTQSFKTPLSVNNTASGSTTVTGPIYLSGSTATGVTFLGSGSLRILSISSSGSSLSFPLNGLTLSASSGNWDGVIQGPEMTTYPLTLPLTGYAFTGMAYQIGNANTELIFSGQVATISMKVGASLSGQTIRVFRSTNQGVSYSELTTCVVSSSGDCVFTTNQLSLFGFAMPADTTPNAFSFSTISNSELSTQYTSNSIIVSGISGSSPISISGGAYNINGGSFTTAPGTTNSGDTIILRLLSSASYSTSTNATLSIGGVTAIFTVTTKATPSSGGGIIIGPSGGGGGGSSGGGGGGGGGGAGTVIDTCLGGDFSPNYYDGICGTIPGSILTGTISSDAFNIPPVFITDPADINFRDVIGTWAENYIMRLVSRGIVDNVAYYHPNASLTRAEFLKIIINTTGWARPTVVGDLPFNDVSLNSWYAPYISVALSRGMIRSSLHFRPNDSITRAEATKVFMEALGVTINEPSTMTFIDVSSQSDLAKYIEAAKFLNILSGQVKNGRHIFRPNDPITRSEIAKVVVNAFSL